MDEGKRVLVQAWCIKARHDLDTARQIANLPDGHLDVAIYHCQQAAEKVLKGFLARHDEELDRTHDLKRLVRLASDRERAFSALMEAAIILTPYATAYRYPGECSAAEPSRAEFDEALRAADRLVRFVLSHLPADFQNL